jgi:hypothetical protein
MARNSAPRSPANSSYPHLSSTKPRWPSKWTARGSTLVLSSDVALNVVQMCRRQQSRSGEKYRGITCTGSPLPSTVNLPNLFAAGTALASTRVTEGFGGAFQPRSTGEDNGTRFLIRYSGFPANTHLYLPDAVAGSDALTPTAGGDLGYRQQAGQYVPGSSTLLLVRVQGADGNGAGGNLVPLPANPGSGALTLNSASEVPLTGGSGYAVYLPSPRKGPWTCCPSAAASSNGRLRRRAGRKWCWSATCSAVRPRGISTEPTALTLRTAYTRLSTT